MAEEERSDQAELGGLQGRRQVEWVGVCSGARTLPGPTWRGI